MRNRIVTAAILSLLCLSHAAAQNQEDLDRLGDKLSHHLATKMPGWKHKRGEPMLGSKNVIEDFWSLPNRVVKVSVVPHKSAVEARDALLGFVKYDREKEELTGVGDEAYAWGYGLSNIAFRRGQFTVFVSTTASVDEDPDARSLSQVERGQREKSEIRRLSREFAKHLADAMALP